MIGTEDDDRADASLRQYAYGRCKIGSRLDRDHIPAPAEQKIFDDHGSLPASGRGL